ncbi:MAG TPA: cupredoxin domain-containing protein [Candidatus Thermoplasmatota archaeon]|nr:cupredoxin domain-containing protein [Candidatus Thermoplasmatota archaeon]
MATARLALLTLALALLLAVPVAEAARVPINVEAGSNPDGSMYFRPDSFSVTQGDEVALTVHNVDEIFHDAAILDYDGRDIENELDPGETGTKTFTASVAGTFRFICEVRGHAGLGMQGNFTVRAANAGTKGAPGLEAPLVAGALLAAAGLALRRRPRRLAPLLGALLVGALLMAGCTSPRNPPDGDTTPPVGTPTGGAFEASFESASTGAIPAGWQAARGTWTVVEDETSPAGSKVLQVTDVAGDYPLLVAPTGTYRDLDASVRFKILGGRDSQSAGIAFHHRDKGNYTVVRINLLEGNGKAFTYVNGDRKNIATGDANATLGAWHLLEVKVRGEEIVMRVDGARSFEVESPANPIGGVGLWTKDDSRTEFDDFTVRPA